jgi:alpha-glucosidase
MPWSHSDPQAGFTTGSEAPWLPIPPEHREQAVDRQVDHAHSVLQQTRSLIALHRGHPAFGHDELTVFPSPEALLVFERGRGETAVLCAFNLSEKPVDYAPPGRWAEAAFLEQGGRISRKQMDGTWQMEGWSWLIAGSHQARMD